MLSPDELSISKADELLNLTTEGPVKLGEDPNSQEPIFFVKNGPYGPYIQQGDNHKDKKATVKTVSLLPGMSPDDVNLETALKILELPRVLGVKPETNEEIVAANGRYGPYIKCGKDSRSLTPQDSPLTITLERALEILAEPKQRKRGGSSQANTRLLGKHPTTEKNITLKDGRFGPYVTDGTINASIPKGADLNALTLDDALNLLELRAAAMSEAGDDEEEKTKKTSTRSRVKKA